MNTTFSSDELEILEYLKSWGGKYVSLVDISRTASGRQRFKERPNWANGLMARLIESKLIEVNERGHYRYIGEAPAEAPAKAKPALKTKAQAQVQPSSNPLIVGDNYFPAPDQPDPPTPRWVSPQIEAILKAKKLASQKKS